MKDSILNSAVIAVALAVILVAAPDERRPAPRPVMAQPARVVQIEKTVVTAKRLQPTVTLAAAAAD